MDIKVKSKWKQMYGKININKKEQIKKQDGCKKSVMVRCRLRTRNKLSTWSSDAIDKKKERNPEAKSFRCKIWAVAERALVWTFSDDGVFEEQRTSVIRGHLCGLQRHSSAHNGAMQFTSMKNRCRWGMKWHMHLQREKDEGLDSCETAWGDGVCECVRTCVNTRA